MEHDNQSFVGSAYTVAAFTLWGLLTLYWDLLAHVPAWEVLAHRLFWTCISVSALLILSGRWDIPRLLRDARIRRRLALTGALLGANWFTYIYAINIGRVLDASMGYYINPLVSVLLGTIVLGERLSPLQKTAVTFATAGVIIIGVHYGVVPWIALMLAGTFGFYGLIKKQMGLPPLTALAAETTFLAPVGLAVVGAVGTTGDGAFLAAGSGTTLLLLVSGAATALPLYWFAHGASRIPLSRVGFIQYIAPTIMLLIGVFIFGEPFAVAEGVSFGLIWSGLAVYSASHFAPVKAWENSLAARLSSAYPGRMMGNRLSRRQARRLHRR